MEFKDWFPLGEKMRINVLLGKSSRGLWPQVIPVSAAWFDIFPARLLLEMEGRVLVVVGKYIWGK